MLRPFALSLLILMWNPAFPSLVTAQTDAAHEGVRGRVTDAETSAPLPGANIVIRGSGEQSALTRGCSTDTDGRFHLTALPAGTYSIRISFVGYEARTMPDVIVRPGRMRTVDVALSPTSLHSDEVEVTAGYFRSVQAGDISTAGFSGEEIRRSPGSAGDVSRIVMVLPSIAKINDQSNSLIVRGGSPLENAFLVNGIEVPNINHFPAQGSSGGPLGLLPVDLIEDVTFSAGGFPAKYGDRLSSVMNIQLRRGDADRVLGQADLNFTGFGGLLEGPVGSHGSWMFSARRSYLDLLVSAINIGTSVAPWYGDAAATCTYDIGASHQLAFVGLWSDDHNNPDAKTAAENDMQHYGRQDIYNHTTGLTWRALWSPDMYSFTTLSLTGMHFNEDFRKTGSNLPALFNDSHEYSLALRTAARWSASPRVNLEFGGDAKELYARYHNRYGAGTDEFGSPTPEFVFAQEASAALGGVFATAEYTPHPVCTVSLGLRALHTTWNRRTDVEPRTSVLVRMSDATSVTAAAGVYTQALPFLLAAQDVRNRTLDNPRAIHGILTLSHLLSENTRITLEGYMKRYDRFPLDPDQPELFLVDELTYRYGFYMPHGRLVSTGTAFSQGLELTVQKKLARDVYGIVCASWSASRYTDEAGVQRARVYDNRVLFSAEGGYKPDASWEFSVRWVYAGGAPYTPLDVEASRTARQEVFDRGRVNGARNPAYHSLNLRVDRRFHFENSAFVTYLSVWNAYNRKNVAGYIWDDAGQRVKTLYQSGMLPIIGVEWEF